MSLDLSLAAAETDAKTRVRTRSLRCAPRVTPSSWVKLLNSPTAFSFDEALLLCQDSKNQWLAWVPDYGELLLSTDEFCSLTED